MSLKKAALIVAALPLAALVGVWLWATLFPGGRVLREIVGEGPLYCEPGIKRARLVFLLPTCSGKQARDCASHSGRSLAHSSTASAPRSAPTTTETQAMSSPK